MWFRFVPGLYADWYVPLEVVDLLQTSCLDRAVVFCWWKLVPDVVTGDSWPAWNSSAFVSDMIPL